MEKKYQVFVSSTYEDLREERQEVIQSLLESGCIPVGMELFPAADDEQWAFIKRVIDDCDYYLVIVAGRYGSLGPDGISYTEMEYRYALDTNKPIIGFLHRSPGEIIAKNTEQDNKDKLEIFKELVRSKLCKTWLTKDELGGAVAKSINQLKQSKPATGWVKADLVPDEEASQEIFRLQKKIAILEDELSKFNSEKQLLLSGLQQGDDKVELICNVSLIGENQKAMVIVQKVTGFSWNDLFTLLGSKMTLGATYREVIQICNEAIYGYTIDSLLNRYGELCGGKILKKNDIHVDIKTDSINVVLIQFFALELMEEERFYHPRVTSRLIKLTQKGKQLLYRSMAKKRTTTIADHKLNEI